MTARPISERADAWPAMPLSSWRDTCATLHLWTQIVGKVRLALTPWSPHSWHATLYVTARGLTTSAIPCGSRNLDLTFDFIEQALRLETSDGRAQRVALRPRSVADFHGAVLAALHELNVDVRIHGAPNEVPDAIPFREDHVHSSYDGDAALRFFRVLSQVDRVFKRFRTGFLGKSSPAHLFWGSFDLAVTRFSGRRAPLHPGGIPHLRDAITREAYSHEVSSAGFWPGGGGYDDAAFYSYAYPAPDGFASAKVEPAEAFFSEPLREFVLPYASMRAANDPEGVLLRFLQTTYEAAANAASWDRDALECELGRPRIPRTV